VVGWESLYCGSLEFRPRGVDRRLSDMVAGSIVEPLVIAGLLSFILAAVMRGLRMWGVPKRAKRPR
jgi:hypothetical protein